MSKKSTFFIFIIVFSCRSAAGDLIADIFGSSDEEEFEVNNNSNNQFKLLFKYSQNYF